MMEMNRENLRCLPYVVWGLGRAALEMAIKPAVNRIVGVINIPSQEDIDSHLAAVVQAMNDVVPETGAKPIE